MPSFQKTAWHQLNSSILDITIEDWTPYDTRLSMDVSIGFVLRDLRKEDSPGVRAAVFVTILEALISLFASAEC